MTFMLSVPTNILHFLIVYTRLIYTTQNGISYMEFSILLSLFCSFSPLSPTQIPIFTPPILSRQKNVILIRRFHPHFSPCLCKHIYIYTHVSPNKSVYIHINTQRWIKHDILHLAFYHYTEMLSQLK